MAIDPFDFAQHIKRTNLRPIQVMETVLDDGSLRLPLTVDPAHHMEVRVNGSGVPFVLKDNEIEISHLRRGDRVTVMGIQRPGTDISIDSDTTGDTKSNTPLQAQGRKVKYMEPLDENHVARLEITRARWETNPPVFALTKDELEYLVMAGTAILRHLKEAEKDEGTDS